MKAVRLHRYGSPDLLQLEEIDSPAPGAHEVLVCVHAACVHPGDWMIVTGRPYAVRLLFGPFRPWKSIPGFDLAGRVEAVGRNVTEFTPGDEIFGYCYAPCAEYACVAEDKLVRKPDRLTFEEAAAVALNGCVALTAIRDRAKAKPGQKVLINGASGGVGTFAVQMAKSRGAEVTGVCSGGNAELVRSIGADRVIDYTREDFTAAEERYDFILDNAGSHSLAELRRTLAPGGIAVPNNSSSGSRWIGNFAQVASAVMLSFFLPKQGRPFVGLPNKERLTAVRDLIECGEVTPVIDRTYPLSETSEAIAYVGNGHSRGNVVVTV